MCLEWHGWDFRHSRTKGHYFVAVLFTVIIIIIVGSRISSFSIADHHTLKGAPNVPIIATRVLPSYPKQNTPTSPIHLLLDKDIVRYLVEERIPHWQQLPVDFSSYHCDPITIARQYSILPRSCQTLPKPIFMLFMITSRPDGFSRRRAVRSTWASLAKPECGVHLVFVVGQTVKLDVQQELITEASQYDDILQTNHFIDNYRGRAVKIMYLVQWAAAFCPDSSYTIKMDDDNWLNIDRYARFLKDHEGQLAVFGNHDPDPSYIGVNRFIENKYYVPREDYAPNFYAPYMSGVLYAYPTKVLAKMLYFAKYLNSGTMEDTFWNGLVASAVNLTRVYVPNYYWFPDKLSSCLKQSAMCVHYTTEELMYRFWTDSCYTYQGVCSVLESYSFAVRRSVKHAAVDVMLGY